MHIFEPRPPIAHIRDAHQSSWDHVSDYIERTIAEHNGLKMPRRWEKRKSNKRVCHRMYSAEKKLQVEERRVVSADTRLS